MIDHKSPMPMYYQIERYIEDLINQKQLTTGDQIPSEREFTDQFHVSRMTVRQAIMNLVHAGILIRIKGKGTFVAAQEKIEKKLLGFNGFSEDMISRGLKPGSRMLHFSIVHPPDKIAMQLKLQEGENVYEIKRVRLADDEPMAIETSYIPVRVLPHLTDQQVSPSLYHYIERETGMTINHAEQSIEASIVTSEEAKILDVAKGSPILLINRCAYLSNGQPIEQTKSLFRADRYKFKIDLPRR
ncbi:GntR family transcriptional regulator [Sporolactobacillus terrae]|uniref:GntR family transcriptional regulator n=1 Tax=Sporolactobacillus terrae TaxID=269673 RepID=A0A410D8P2_9BACL|nr:GntR family transcriptional regulator [Sporolactobacillus terrae]QAA22472.1 GntR family transcriptional regulator [Sporolactobacillus terrae]QAA25446.1 GntR family transcriptional regulator [Sporolactobacillus terrae]UAK17256.1 GntR family transcriptional regulator [Sporolactobacillus terrae]BBN98781.1 phosphonate metabolism transcriptional regulator PhnF [Sporolactobacillus terrae]